MSLALYKFSNAQAPISKDGSYSNPVLWEVGENGGVLERKFYLRMDEEGESLTDGELFAIDASGTDESEWYSFAPDSNGGPGTYSDIFNFEIPLGAEVQVWIKVEVPEAIEVEPKDDLKIAATYIRHVVA
jgi:hypothetical protein